MSRGALVGEEPVDNVILMEDHDQAYREWKKAGLRNRILVHLDPHIDFKWISDEDPQAILRAATIGEIEKFVGQRRLWNFSSSPGGGIHIGNFIYPAMKDGIVREFYWVVPDDMGTGPRAKREFGKIFSDLRRALPERVRDLKVTEKGVRCRLDGIPTTACALRDLPSFSEEILLDIDTDFFAIHRWRDSYPWYDPDDLVVWIQPRELLKRLREKRLRTDFATVAYSIEGGYTPIEYKHLGDELKSLLQGNGNGTGMDSAVEDGASALFQKARESLRRGESERARVLYRQALQKDSSYGSAYNNPGIVYQNLNRWKESRRAFDEILALDPKDPHALCGLGNFWAHQKKWGMAASCYEQALDVRPDLEEVRYKLALMRSRQKEYLRAITLLEGGTGYKDYQALTQILLGFLYRKTGDWQKATAAYEEVSRRVRGWIQIHFHLGFLYLRQRRFYKAWRRLRSLLILLPRYGVQSIRWRSRVFRRNAAC